VGFNTNIARVALQAPTVNGQWERAQSRRGNA